MTGLYEYRATHRIPRADVYVSRMEFLKQACKGKTVLDIGCWGDNMLRELSPAHLALKKVAKRVVGVDMVGIEKDDPDYIKMDIEKDSWDVLDGDWDYVVCFELIEHLQNPGMLLHNLKRFNCPILFSTPNPWSTWRSFLMGVGIENTPEDHLNYFSYTTFGNLCRDIGYRVNGFAYCGRQKGDICWLSSGLIFEIQKEGE